MTSCIDNGSALTFLDLSWGGQFRGRVYIRMTGKTTRGLQFVMLCTGEKGPSFLNSHFHRIWWKGLPGEHIWGGDVDKGDGSGGMSLIGNVDGNAKLAESCWKMPITAGLVAGRYETKNASSIFRIYTKDAKDAEEEAAFGRVEYGLQFIDAAVNWNNIKDVVVSDCGVVIESP